MFPHKPKTSQFRAVIEVATGAAVTALFVSTFSPTTGNLTSVLTSAFGRDIEVQHVLIAVADTAGKSELHNEVVRTAPVVVDPPEHFSASHNWFTDTSLNTPIGEAANILADRGVAEGFEDNTFRPEQPISRAAVAKLILTAKYGEISNQEYTSRFSDVPENAWFTDVIMKAVDLGALNGYPDGTVRPEQSVITAEFVTILAKTFGIQPSHPHSFEDLDEDAYYAPYTCYVANLELFPDRKNTLQPERVMTRGEAALAIVKLLWAESLGE